MKILFLLAAGLSVFGVFIAQLIALTNAPYTRLAIGLRIGAFLVWFASLVLMNGQLLDVQHCHERCILGMTPQSFVLELCVMVASWAVAWFSIKAVPLVAKSR